ncbi:non-specific lipid transfer protein GPI-anchored 2 [Elaeis guineensis]|uniref:Non-specific Lipid transfer protein GPI-anchored 2 n=1 Tax=Elaeis guineensis var. tenera TaxID=51953 RepID=A0A6I9RS03_ELAGV|nr:non-specific lipid transfer protein GPI-anchored 2 [Elaeis guineensis]XP_010931470.1 non-specific lipid transfer protein GPI-anchored 2 [Elaeis guineensis]
MSMIRRSPVVAIIVACAIFYGVRSQSLAPAPAPAGMDCVMAVSNATDCLTYVQAGSKAKVPDKNCCPEIASLVDNYPMCLCELLGGAASSYGISIDTARALKLPSVCHVTTPPVSTCSALGIPISSPSMAPGSSESPSSGGPELPAGSAPSSPPTSNHGNPCFNGIEFVLLASFSFIVAAVVGIF